MRQRYILPILILLSFVEVTCNKDEQVVAPTIDNEALTTVQLHLVNAANIADSTVAQWEQLLDNNGNPLPEDLTKDTLKLKPNVTYNAKLVMLDKTQVPVFIVSNEILLRANYHLFFYQPLATTLPLVIPNNYPAVASDVYPAPIPTPVPVQDPLNLTVTITDHDTNTPPLPIGLQTTFTTGAVSHGWLRLVLRHQPNQKNGTYSPGSTDLDVGFVVTIR